MSIASALGVTSAGRIAALLAIVAAASATGGFWAGMEWQRGQQAQVQVIALRADAATLRAAVAEMRKQSADAAQDMRTAATRMDNITLDHWRALNALDTLYVAHRDALDEQLATAATAELRACRIGDFGLQLWAAAAAGHPVAASGTTAAGAGPSANRVPSRAADAGERHGQGRDGSMDRSGADVPPMSHEQVGAVGGGVDL